jgi:acyl carrier protein
MIAPADLAPATAPPSAGEIRDWLTRYVAALVELPAREIDVQAPHVDLGLSSQDLVILSGDLEDWLGCEVSPTLAWEYPTIAALADHLAAAAAERA